MKLWAKRLKEKMRKREIGRGNTRLRIEAGKS